MDTIRNQEKQTLQEKHMKREEKVRKLLQQLADDTTMHGFKHIHYNRGPRKYVWVIALILAIALVTILFHSTVTDYFNYKTYIETEYHEEKESLPFPTVTICFSDNFVNFKFKKFPGNITLEQYKQVFNVIHGDKKITKEDIALLEGLNVGSYEELVRSIHLTLEETIMYKTSLIFNHGTPCRFSRQKCTRKDLKLVWQMHGGRSCVQFNSYHPDKKQREQTKISFSFRVYLDGRAKYNKDFFPPGMYRYRKMVLYVHEYGHPHEMYLGKTSNAILIERLRMDPGRLNKFFMDRHEINYMEPPYGTCGRRELKVIRYYPYSVNACIMDCILQYILKKCDCIRFDLQYAVGNHIPVCSVSQMVRCYIPAMKSARKESRLCIGGCPLQCRQYEFNILREEVPLPTHHNKEMEVFLGITDKNSSLRDDYIKGQIVGVQLSYRKMREHIETYNQLVTLPMLLGTIGGSIGLGMGLSLLTVVEFCMFIVDSIKIMILKRKIFRYAARRGSSIFKSSLNGEAKPETHEMAV